MPARVRAQISCEQTHSCDGNGEMNASSAFERQQRKFERKKKEKKKKDGTSIQKMLDSSNSGQFLSKVVKITEMNRSTELFVPTWLLQSPLASNCHLNELQRTFLSQVVIQNVHTPFYISAPHPRPNFTHSSNQHH